MSKFTSDIFIENRYFSILTLLFMAAVRNSAATKHTRYLNTSFYKLHISKIIANRTLAIISIVIIHFKDFSRSQAVNVPETVKDTDFLLQIMIIIAENTGRENDAKITICAPSHNFVGLYLRN